MGTVESEIQKEEIVKSIIEQPEEIIDQPIEQIDETEEKAKSFGWKPDYEGPNKKTAKEFLETGEKIAASATETKRRLERENEILRKSYENMMQASAETIKKIKEDNDKRIQDLEVVKKTARDNLDVEGLEKAITEQGKLQQSTQQLQQAVPQIDPAFQTWVQENPDFVQKYENDVVLRAAADAWALSNKDYLLTLPVRDRYEKIRENMQTEMPNKFGNPNQQQAPRTLTMNRTQTPNKPNEGKLTISTLPADEKAAYEVIVKAKGFKTTEAKKAFDERYLEEYKTWKNLK